MDVVTSGMARLDAGTFRMGSDEFYADERPVYERAVSAFWIDAKEVTNEDYDRFVSDTGYVTIAEQQPDRRDFPEAHPDQLVPGSMVFTPTTAPTDLGDWRNWWRWQPGASWRAPFGPSSSTADRVTHPVVHIAFADAQAYAAWAGKRLPTEAEHEYASRGGIDQQPFAWGTEPYPGGVPQANSWLGRFPYDNRGRGDTSPVGSYPANAYGLFDMIGNVWEWTTDLYRPRHVVPSHASPDAGGRQSLLAHPSGAHTPVTARRVLKGGSFLCSPDYCLRFRPAARSPQTEDTGMSHVGFRCALDA